MPVYDAMLDYPIHHVLVRHEQGAAHMADGYARASGKVGVAMATSGPGATNLVTGIATAMMDSVPGRLHHRAGASRFWSAVTPFRRRMSPASPCRLPSTITW
jgi:glyoxylate carboligase